MRGTTSNIRCDVSKVQGDVVNIQTMVYNIHNVLKNQQGTSGQPQLVNVPRNLSITECTPIDYVALEAFRVDRLLQLNESPVREAFFAGTDRNRRGVEDLSQDALVLCAPEPRDLTVELVQGPYRLLRLRQLALKPFPHVSYPGVLALNSLPKTLKLVFVVVDHDSLAPNLARDRLEYVLVGLVAEEDNLAARRTVSLAGVELIRIFTRRENSMAGRKEEDTIAFTTFSEVESTGAFEMKAGFESDLETECRSERAVYVGSLINGGDVVEELRTGGPGEDRLAECDLDAGSVG